MKILNPINLPFNKGITLIEASAGTGKTFTISLLYIRLLLGLGNENSYYRTLSVEEILVVTFTESATIELRNRICNDINELLQACIYKNQKNKKFNELLKEIVNPLESAKLLLIAKKHINKASIFTIHSFCQRMLHFYAFNHGIQFKQKIIENENFLLKKAIINFWRKYFYPLNIEIARLIKNEWNSPNQLLEFIKPWIYRKIFILNSSVMDNETLNSRHEFNLIIINKIKNKWKIYNHLIKNIINNSDIDKRCYNDKYLSKWIFVINEWSNLKTYDYFYPKELKKFNQETLKNKTKIGKKAPIHILFSEIKTFLNQNINLRELVIYKALIEVRNFISENKKYYSLIGFNDLLIKLYNKLQNSDGLLFADKIRNRFPVAMIDEFQDTDPLQYNIFFKIYNNQFQYFLLLIGDPKQSIYSFRGSDIFTYIKARNKVDNFYKININWRSSTSIVNNINNLFLSIKNPFIFHEINFVKVKSTIENQNLYLIINDKKQNSLNFWVQPGELIDLNNYYEYMSHQCSININKLLYASRQKKAFLVTNQYKRLVQESDIVVLVRNYYEAKLIYDSLLSLSIPSIYLSNNENIYNTIEAKELLWLLKAIIYPKQNILLRRALSTTFFSINASILESYINDKNLWNKLVDDFIYWNKLWYKYNVSTMLHNIIKKNNIIKSILLLKDGEIKLNNLFYLIELLQNNFINNNNPYELIRFLEKQINDHNQFINKYSNLENNNIKKNVVKIITIHKSKGSEYPIVWIPFSAAFRQTFNALFYDKKNYLTILDLQNTKSNLEIADKERLSEDLRLLYVALTRAIFHCNVGIAPIFTGRKKNINSNSHLHFSAIGYLIQDGKAMSSFDFYNRLNELKNKNNICVIKEKLSINNIEQYKFYNKDKKLISINYRQISNLIDNHWKIININKLISYEYLDFIKLDKFFHNLLANINFNKPINIEKLKTKLLRIGYSETLLPKLITWIYNIFYTKLNSNNLKLSLLNNNDILINFDFFIITNKNIDILNLNSLINSYYKNNRFETFNLKNTKSITTGVIDLIFKWHNKYYLLDYKLDNLGKNNYLYTQKIMNQHMIKNQYYLQYHINCLALHRYLKIRSKEYDYNIHFGGMFYLFIQGMNNNSNNYGILEMKPPYELINYLDKYFNNIL